MINSYTKRVAQSTRTKKRKRKKKRKEEEETVSVQKIPPVEENHNENYVMMICWTIDLNQMTRTVFEVSSEIQKKNKIYVALSRYEVPND